MERESLSRSAAILIRPEEPPPGSADVSSAPEEFCPIALGRIRRFAIHFTSSLYRNPNTYEKTTPNMN